jgi:hypothetical protein
MLGHASVEDGDAHSLAAVWLNRVRLRRGDATFSNSNTCSSSLFDGDGKGIRRLGDCGCGDVGGEEVLSDRGSGLSLLVCSERICRADVSDVEETWTL